MAATTWTQPVYRARTALQLNGFNEQWREISPVSPLPNASAVDYLQNEVKVLQSDTLARRVAQQLWPQPEHRPVAVHKTSLLGFLFASRPPAPVLSGEQALVGRFKSSLTVRTALQSQVIEVFFDAPDPTLAARAANAVTSEFINLNREARAQLVQDTTEWLNRQTVELRAKLETANRRLQDYTARSGLLLESKEGSPMQARLRQLEETLTRAEADRAAKQARYQLGAGGEIASDALASGPLRQYQADLQNMRRQLAELRTIYTPQSPKIARVEAQLAETEAAIAEEKEHVVERLRNEYGAAASLERALSESMRRQLATLERQNEKQLQYNVLKNDVDTAQKLYDSVLERAKEAGAASSFRITNIRVIDSATPPTSPYTPNPPLNVAFGLGMGTIGGVGLVLLRPGSGKVKKPGELMSVDVPELGVIPSVSTKPAIAGQDAVTEAIPQSKFNDSLLQECVRSALVSILFCPQLRHGGIRRPGRGRTRVIVLTSVDMREGKTTTAINLGRAAAAQNRAVLVVDADFRRPMLHNRFGLNNNAGLADLLRTPDITDLVDTSSPECLIQPTSTPNLWVLTSGPRETSTVNPLQFLDLERVLEHLTPRFDLILIDTPPMSMYSDARVLGHISDGVIMVIRANTKAREELIAAYEALVHDQIPVLGAILNNWKMDRSQARAYGHYYNYYQQQNGGPS